MNIKRAWFFSIEELEHVLDEGVTVEFRKMITLGGLSISEESETKFLVYARHFPPGLDLGDSKHTILHELTHASIIQKGIRDVSKDEASEARQRRENQIDEHVEFFRGNEEFFSSLVRELISRRNCSIVFNGSIFDETGKTECPFFHYYNRFAQ
jgi:hypothetical protein